MEAWNLRTIQKASSHKSTDGRVRIRAGIPNLIHDDRLQMKYGPTYSGLWYLLELLYGAAKKKGENRDRYDYYDYRVKKEINEFLDKLMEMIIFKDGIYSFPNKKAYMFVAEMSLTNKDFTYDMTRGSGDVRLYYINRPPLTKSDKYAVVRLVSLSGHWQKVLQQEIARGHKYPNFDYVFKKITEHVYHGKTPNRAK